MARPREYTPARRYIMQGVMWLILGLTVALAGLVTRANRRANRVELAPQISEGGVTLRLPAGWNARPRTVGDPRVVAQAGETLPSGEPGRQVRVLRDRLDVPASPMQYLQEHFAVLNDDAGADDATGIAASTTDVGGYPGVLAQRVRATSRRGGGRASEQLQLDQLACAVLPSLDVIVIHLSGQGADQAGDVAVVEQVARTIRVDDVPQLEPPGGSVTLPEGIQFSAPQRYNAIARHDPNRTDRRLWRIAASGGDDDADRFESMWTTIDLVGCLFPNYDPADPGQRAKAQAAMTTLLLVRDPRWRGASVIHHEGNWQADLPESAQAELFPARAYLRADPSGRALLAVFYGGLGGGRGFDRAWAELSSSIKFHPAADNSQLEDAGAAEAARLRAQGFDALVGEREPLWWMWTGPKSHVGWSRVEWTAGGDEADAETRLRTAGGSRVIRIANHSSARNDGAAYRAEAQRMTSHRDGDAIGSLKQATELRDGQLAVSMEAAGEWAAPAPSQFVPGQLLSLIVGKLSPGPLLLRTESFLGAEAVGPLEPLTVVFRPAENTTRRAEGEDEPMRCVAATVNGSGRVSRWYFRSTGELEAVELPDGVQRLPSDAKRVNYNFAADALMKP